MGKARILIVEDESIIADDLAQTLEKHDYEVTAIARSGEEAIRSATEAPPELVLMDIHLKGRPNGITTIYAIRRELDRPIPVIFLTATRVARMEKVPGSMILDKPFLERELISFIQRSLSTSEPLPNLNEQSPASN